MIPRNLLIGAAVLAGGFLMMRNASAATTAAPATAGGAPAASSGGGLASLLSGLLAPQASAPATSSWDVSSPSVAAAATTTATAPAPASGMPMMIPDPSGERGLFKPVDSAPFDWHSIEAGVAGP